MNDQIHPTLRDALNGIYNTIQESIGSPLRMPEAEYNSTIKEMISDFESKELFVTVDDLEPESHICDYCDGECEVIATEKINSATIDIPYKRCPECGGTGIKE